MAPDLSLGEWPEWNSLRAPSEGLGDLGSGPDVGGPGQQEEPGRTGVGSTLTVDPALDRLDQARRLLELVDEEGEAALRDKAVRVGVRGGPRTRIVQADPLRPDIRGDLLRQSALAALTRADEDDDRSVPQRGFELGAYVSLEQRLIDAQNIADIYADAA
jgi:hypothetical protein